MLLNRWTGVGRLGRDAELNYTPSGKAVSKFSLAVDNNVGKDADGNRKGVTMWLTIICWERLAEKSAEKLRKGMEVLVEGRLNLRPYQDKTGQDRMSAEITATMVQPTQYVKTETFTSAPEESLGELDDHPF